MPLLNSATGRAYAVFMAEDIVRPLLEQEWQQKQLQQQRVYPANWTEFLQMKQSFIKQGAATVSGDMLVGVNAICVPIFNAQGEIEFCIAALGSEAQLPIDLENERVKALKETAHALTRYIAHR